jgi:hypothetical protein
MTELAAEAAPLSPARQELLKNALDIQERMLDGCILIFEELSNASDPDVAFVAEEALEALNRNRDILEAMIDGLNATHH